MDHRYIRVQHGVYRQRNAAAHIDTSIAEISGKQLMHEWLINRDCTVSYVHDAEM